jgi:hypothetical protein
MKAWIDGVSLWTPAWPGWEPASAAYRGQAPASAAPPAPSAARPAPAALPPNERRRASDAVLLALKVAEDAVADSGHAANALASVFTSAHGDLGIVDALARTLASDPLLLSPMRFHHSVHNAASGYWSMASGSHAPSTALAAYRHSFAAGLLEALAQCAADVAPVLLVGTDTEAGGPLASVNTSRGLLGAALVLAPARGPRSRWELDWALESASRGGNTDPAAPAGAAARARAGNAMAAARANAMADALPLLERLAAGRDAALGLPLGTGSSLRVQLTALVRAG